MQPSSFPNIFKTYSRLLCCRQLMISRGYSLRCCLWFDFSSFYDTCRGDSCSKPTLTALYSIALLKIVIVHQIIIDLGKTRLGAMFWYRKKFNRHLWSTVVRADWSARSHLGLLCLWHHPDVNVDSEITFLLKICLFHNNTNKQMIWRAFKPKLDLSLHLSCTAHCLATVSFGGQQHFRCK